MVNFLATQVSTSLVFAALAKGTRLDLDKRQVNLAYARDGYAIALYFLGQAQRRQDRVSPHVVESIKMLRSMSREMGESLD